MAWRLLGAKPLPGPMLIYDQLNPQEQISVKFKAKNTISIQENSFENGCKLPAIISMASMV